MHMILKPQDVFILLKLIVIRNKNWSYSFLADELYMSKSEVHSGIRRTTIAKLFDANRKQPIKKALDEFLIHGVKYAYPPDIGSLTRGIPTSYAGPPLDRMIRQPSEKPPVWPDPDGQTQGYSFSPLFKSVPKAASIDADLYELLVLVDAIRGGRAREREIATNELRLRLRTEL